MRYRKLGNTDIEVSVLCLGTMTFGQQNTEEEGHEQLNYALTQGINFVDTAEMYSVPGNEKTQGSTERIIGTWLKKYGRRNEIILASKVTGPSPAFAFLSPNLGFSRNRLLEAIDNNLTRLQTDYLDIYQLHWPERKSNFFSTLGYVHHPEDQWEDNFEEAISTLNELVKVGKIRHWGLSNETPWGMMRTCSVSDNLGLPRPISVQNPYNLLNRAYEVGMAEISIREKISLLVYSPMAFGLLSGKYHQKLDHPQDRLNQFKQMARYNNDLSYQATSKYLKIAKDAGMSLAQMSLAFVNDQPFVTSNILGATNMEQLKENIKSINIALGSDILDSIEKVHKEISNPAP